MQHFVSVSVEFRTDQVCIIGCGVWYIPLQEELVVGCEIHQQIATAIRDLEDHMLSNYAAPRTAICFAPFMLSEPAGDLLGCHLARTGEYSRCRFTLEHVAIPASAKGGSRE